VEIIDFQITITGICGFPFLIFKHEAYRVIFAKSANSQAGFSIIRKIKCRVGDFLNGMKQTLSNNYLFLAIILTLKNRKSPQYKLRANYNRFEGDCDSLIMRGC